MQLISGAEKQCRWICGKRCLIELQHVLVKLDSQVGMQSALHQHPRAAQRNHLLDLRVNIFERQDVPVLGPQRPVERAERAILGAEIGVVDVPVDLVGSHARISLPPPHFVSRHPDPNQVMRLKHLQCFLL